jgi:hypothetical protein
MAKLSIGIAFYVLLRSPSNTIADHCDIFSEHETLRLTIENVRKLDHAMRSSYASWVATTPDPLFKYGQPITISYCYGQNVQLKWSEAKAQADAFNQAHDFKYVRSVDLALASHLR